MSDNDYRFGTPDDALAGQDNRADYRLTARACAILELESPSPETPGPQGLRELVCQIRDISAGGLCLLSPEPLSLGALLPADVAFGRYEDRFRLAVEVVWCRPSESEFLVGVHIIESDETAYVEWVEAVAEVMAED